MVRIQTISLQKYYLRTTLSLLVAGFLCWAGIRGGIYDVRPIKISTANQYIVKPLDAALVMNTPFSVIRTLGKDVFQNPHYFATEQEAARYRKNVVVIILESFAREYFGSLNRGILPNYKGYTEFLDSLIDHSITFEHSFANGHSSIDAMPSTLSGLPMFVQSYVTTTRAMNRLGGLADCLGSKGYQTASSRASPRPPASHSATAWKTTSTTLARAARPTTTIGGASGTSRSCNTSP